MSHVNAPSPNVDRKPFPFPVPETSLAVYGVGDGRVPPPSDPFTGATTQLPPPWYRLSEPKLQWYVDPTFDHPDAKLRSTVDRGLPPPPDPGSISPRVALSSYDDDRIAGGLLLSHTLNGLPPQPLRHESVLPTSAYRSNTGKSLIYFIQIGGKSRNFGRGDGRQCFSPVVVLCAFYTGKGGLLKKIF